jgi:hypothetical protein
MYFSTTDHTEKATEALRMVSWESALVLGLAPTAPRSFSLVRVFRVLRGSLLFRSFHLSEICSFTATMLSVVQQCDEIAAIKIPAE